MIGDKPDHLIRNLSFLQEESLRNYPGDRTFEGFLKLGKEVDFPRN
jgi:hypothetical protein